MDTSSPAGNYASQFLGKEVEIKIDRPLHSKHPKYEWEYQLNYGFVPDTQAPDGEETDAYLIGVEEPVETYKGKCIAIIHRTDDNDDKLIIVPPSHGQISDDDIRAATHFQEQFFKSEIIRA